MQTTLLAIESIQIFSIAPQRLRTISTPPLSRYTIPSSLLPTSIHFSGCARISFLQQLLQQLLLLQLPPAIVLNLRISEVALKQYFVRHLWTRSLQSPTRHARQFQDPRLVPLRAIQLSAFHERSPGSGESRKRT